MPTDKIDARTKPRWPPAAPLEACNCDAICARRRIDGVAADGYGSTLDYAV